MFVFCYLITIETDSSEAGILDCCHFKLHGYCYTINGLR